MRFYFDEAKLWASSKNQVYEKINQSGLPLVLFGKAAAVNNRFLEDIHVPLQFICDNSPAKWGTRLWGLEVIPPAEIEKIYSAYNVLILVPFEHQIIPQLQSLPVPPAHIFRLDLYFEEENSAACFQNRQMELAAIYDQLADQESRDTYEAVIRYRINRNPAYLNRVALPRAEQYFPERLGGMPFLGENECFVDAGAFTGDTVENFLSAVNKRYQAIYAFEPERANYQKLLETAKGLQNISCRPIAVGERKDKICFISDDSGSKADVSGGEPVFVDTIDHLIGDAPVTYLKMDVEGMECAALRGAKSLIQRCRPKLAICTYHSDADMIDVPALIMKLNPDYRLYFRHYSPALVETVCFAV